MKLISGYKNLLKSKLFNSNVEKIFEVFEKNNYEIKIVGGAVRDTLFGLESDDIDFATNADPQTIQQILKKEDIYYYNSGLKHGTITAVFDKKSYEITTLRYDKKCDGRHATVEFTSDWKLDAERRDFTFNALYSDKSGNIYDYFDGIKDLKKGILNFIQDPEKRIQEDYLRILRAFRFYNRFCSHPLNEKTEEIIKQNAFNIDKLSGERIQIEIIKLLNNYIDEKNKTFNLLNKFNELNISKYVFLKKNIDYSSLNLCLNLDSWSKIGILCRYNYIDINKLKNRWSISNKNFAKMKNISDIRIQSDILKMQNKYLYLYFEIYEVFLTCYLIEKLINKDIFNKLLHKFHQSEKPQFPITNKILMNHGFIGSEIGENLKKSLDLWLESDCLLEEEGILKLLD